MRNMRKLSIDLPGVQMRTEFVKRYAAETIAHARAYESDSRRAERLRERECPWCFYFRHGMLAGQAFTDWACSACGTEASHPNTATPYLCAACSDRLGLCIRCTADLDLKTRRTLERK